MHALATPLVAVVNKRLLPIITNCTSFTTMASELHADGFKKRTERTAAEAV